MLKQQDLYFKSLPFKTHSTAVRYSHGSFLCSSCSSTVRLGKLFFTLHEIYAGCKYYVIYNCHAQCLTLEETQRFNKEIKQNPFDVRL